MWPGPTASWECLQSLQLLKPDWSWLPEPRFHPDVLSGLSLQSYVSLLYRKNKWYIYTFPSLIRFPSHLGDHWALNRVPYVLTIFFKSHFLFYFSRTLTLLNLSCFLWNIPGLYCLCHLFLISSRSISFTILDSIRTCSDNNMSGKKWVK